MKVLTDSFTTGSVGAGSSLAIDRPIPYQDAFILKVKVVPSVASGTTSVGIFKRAACLDADVAYRASDFSGNLYDPIQKIGDTEYERNEGFVAWYEDFDAGQKLHLKIFNQSSVAKTFGVTVSYLVSFDRLTNIKDFKAMGDGSTDDTDAILAAWDVIKTVGGTLFVPRGTFVHTGLDFSTASALYEPSWRIMGEGPGISILKSVDAEIALDLGGLNGVTMRDLQIYDTGTAAKIGIARYRTESAFTGHHHLYENIHVRGVYLAACLVSVSSEVNDHNGINLENYGSGAGYYTGPVNDTGVTMGQAVVTTAFQQSNTRNNFFGGTISSVHGPAVSVNGICNCTSFSKSYLQSTNNYGLYIRSNSLQGQVELDHVLIETSANGAHGICADPSVTEIWGMRLRNVTFGLSGDGTTRDVYAPNADLRGCVIEDCWHGFTNANSGGIVVAGLHNTQIRFADYDYPGFSHPPVTVGGVIGGSYIQCPVLNGAYSLFLGSVWVQTDKAGGKWIVHYGPKPGSANGTFDVYGSAVVFTPFPAAPVAPETGMIVMADREHWDPLSKGSGGCYPVYYNGSDWVAPEGDSLAVGGLRALSTGNVGVGLAAADMVSAFGVRGNFRVVGATFAGGNGYGFIPAADNATCAFGYTTADGNMFGQAFSLDYLGRLKLNLGNIPIYANNAAAAGAGLTAGALYRNGADPDHLCIVH